MFLVWLKYHQRDILLIYPRFIFVHVTSMTDGAQQALRRTMEIYSNTTRFALACNNSEKIIEPIQSRCCILRYNKLTDAQLLAKITEICQKESVSLVKRLFCYVWITNNIKDEFLVWLFLIKLHIFIKLHASPFFKLWHF